MNGPKRILLIVVLWPLLLPSAPARAVELHSLGRLKGQEPVRLTGLGLVVGLNGTGDTRFDPTNRAVAQMLNLFGNQVGDIEELASAKNLALVTVHCEINSAGGREGGRFDCFVSSLGTAKSLAGGRLIRTPMRGPFSKDERFYALAEGKVSIESATTPTDGRVSDGCKLESDFLAPFFIDDRAGESSMTFVIDNAHAGFQTADAIANAINQWKSTQVGGQQVALALDQKNVLIKVPTAFRTESRIVGYVADLMTVELDPQAIHTKALIVINERTGTIVLTAEVELTPALVAHRNLIVFPGGAAAPAGLAPNQFTALSPDGPPSNVPLPARLNDLLTALNRAQVAAADRIAIVKSLHRSGSLYGEVVYE